MKKALLATAAVALTLASCNTVDSTSTVLNIPTSVTSENVADLEVSDKVITYTYVPTADVRRGGPNNVKRTAVAEALKANGGGDVLVSPQYQTTTWRGLLRKRITKVTVTGHVGKYKNVRPACKPCPAQPHKK